MFGTWCIADTDLAMRLQRLARTGFDLPARVRACADAEWARPSVRAFVDHPRPPFERSLSQGIEPSAAEHDLDPTCERVEDAGRGWAFRRGHRGCGDACGSMSGSCSLRGWPPRAARPFSASATTRTGRTRAARATPRCPTRRRKRPRAG